MAKKQTPEQDASHELHYAKLGLFLSDENGDIYALTCKHVTKSASDGKVYVETRTGKKEAFGRLCHQNEDQQNILPEFCDDVDVVRIDNDFQPFCSNYDSRLVDKYKRFTVYGGDIGGLYNSKISSLCNGSVSFQEDSDNETDSSVCDETALSSFNMNSQTLATGCITGDIQSRERHESEGGIFSPIIFYCE